MSYTVANSMSQTETVPKPMATKAKSVAYTVAYTVYRTVINMYNFMTNGVSMAVS